MGLRPNIQSLKLDGKDLTVKGETDVDALPVAIFVVVHQGTAGATSASASGIADRVGSGWTALLEDTTFHTGPAETVGVQVHVKPFQVTSWVQSLTIT